MMPQLIDVFSNYMYSSMLAVFYAHNQPYQVPARTNLLHTAKICPLCPHLDCPLHSAASLLLLGCFHPVGISGTFLQVQPMLINSAFGMCLVKHLRYFPAKCNPCFLLAPFSMQETGEPSSGMQGATVVFALQAGVFKRFF